MRKHKEGLESQELYNEITKKMKRYTGKTDVADIVQEAYCRTFEQMKKTGGKIKNPVNHLFITCRNIWINNGVKNNWRAESDYMITQKVYDWAFKHSGDPELEHHIETFIAHVDCTKFPLLKEWLGDYLAGVDTRRIALSYYRIDKKLIRKSEEEILRICDLKTKAELDEMFELPNAYPHANVSFPVNAEMKKLREYINKIYEDE